MLDALQLHRDVDGKPGIDGPSRLTGQALQALAIIDDARAEKMREVAANGRTG